MSSVTLRELTKQYSGNAALSLDSVNLDVAHGEFVCLVGPSGCGKTTALRMIAGLESVTRAEIARLHHRLGATMIYVTHDQVEAMTMADRIAVINLGKLEQVGSPRELYDRPANQFVAVFIGSPSMNFVPMHVESVDGGIGVVSAGGDIDVTLDDVESATIRSAGVSDVV